MSISDLDNVLPDEQALVDQAVEQVLQQAGVDLVVQELAEEKIQELSEAELQESIEALEPVAQKETPDELAMKELRAKYAKNR